MELPTNVRLYICTTCDRQAQKRPEELSRGQTLVAVAQAYAQEHGLPCPTRAVPCLMGCPEPCNAVLRAPGKFTMRFARVDPSDIPALFEVATSYAEKSDGNLNSEALPQRLRAKVAARIPPIQIAS